MKSGFTQNAPRTKNTTWNMSDLVSGPNEYWSETLPPSRGQYRDIALIALDLLGIERPQTRLDATVAMVRLRAAVQDKVDDKFTVPDPW
jgi:hypothetical protein